MYNQGNIYIEPSNVPSVNNPQPAKSKKLPYVLLMIIVALLMLGVGIFIGLNLVKSNDTIAESEAQETTNDSLNVSLSDEKQSEIDAYMDEVWAILQESGPDTYIETYQQKIDSESNKYVKAQYYLNRAVSLYTYDTNEENSFAHSEQILSDAYNAEKLYPDANSAYAIFSYEAEFGDDEKANEYEKIADERIEKQER
jgi:hypothetical protein